MKHYVYPLEYLADGIEDYLDGYDYPEDSAQEYEVDRNPYYGYIINSSMTDIDVAFISSDMDAVVELSEYDEDNPMVAAILWGADPEITEDILSDEERKDYAEQLYAKGIDIICDEDGYLAHIGDALVLPVHLTEFLNGLDINTSALEDDEISTWQLANHIVWNIKQNYTDNIYEDLYINERDNRLIFVINKGYSRF